MKPGFVDTDAVALFKPVFTPESFMDGEEVAKKVHWLIEQPEDIHIQELTFGTYFEISPTAARQRLKDMENSIEDTVQSAFGIDEEAAKAGGDRQAMKELIAKRIKKTQEAKVGEKAVEQLKAGDPTMGVLDD
tara:strand:+ start:76 stop:474 length:399 start_codon:yes stop_codon:yes gene_type:complete